MKKDITKSACFGVLLLIFLGIISCEKDFTDIGTNIVNNTKFTTGNLILDIDVKNVPTERVISDNISVEPGQYLLGVFAKPDYEKIEASIISQIAINTGLKLVDETSYGADTTTIVSTIDTVFIKLPYQATLQENTSSGPDYQLDSIIGNTKEPFLLNVYRSDTYLSRLNLADPTKNNSYYSNDDYQKIGSPLNAQADFQFIPNKNDTVIIVNRRSSENILYDKDTIRYTTSSNTDLPLPFARIPLKEEVFKELFLEKYEEPEFSSQNSFNDYFRGIILEATGGQGSLISFNFNNTSSGLNPSIEVFYTNTVFNSTTGKVIDTIKKKNTFSLSGIRRNIFKMTDRVYPENQEVKIQGTAGSEARITLFGADADENGVADKLEELRAKNLLVNDASITFYVNQSVDTTSVPYQLLLYQEKYDNNNQPIFSQIKDSYSEFSFYGGRLEVEDQKKDRYTFRITDYISDLLSGAIAYSSPLRLKVYNSMTDSALKGSVNAPITDTIVRNYNWNPKAVTLLNHASINGARRTVLKISYSQQAN